MSIQVTTLKGTNSIASDRITINDNFSINTDAINDILGILDTTTGKFDNTGIGANSTITTEGLTITLNGLEVQGTGNINVSNGYLKLATNGNYIELGANGSKIEDNVISAGNHVLDTQTNFVGLGIPKRTTAQIATLTTDLTSLGANAPAMIVYDTDAFKYKCWNFDTATFDNMN
jgi:hypothetical protein